MWHITEVNRPNDERVTIIGGNGNDIDYRNLGDRLGGGQYLVYVEHVGGIILRDAGHVTGGPHYWAVQVNNGDYWYYDGEGHCTISVQSDGSFTVAGQNNSVKGQAIPEAQIEFLSSYRQSVEITQQQFSLAFTQTRVPSFELLSDGDVINLQANNQRYLTVDTQKRIVATVDSPDQAEEITVEKSGSHCRFKIGDAYVGVDEKDGHLYADPDEKQAASFEAIVTAYGTIRLSTADDNLIQLKEGDSQGITVGDLSHYSLLTSFNVGFRRVSTEAMLARHGATMLSEEEITSCETAWASFIWKLTGGFFLAIGLGTYISEGRAATGLLALLRTNRRAWQAVQALQNNKTITATAGLGVVGILYEEGLLWDAFKMAMAAVGWWGAALALKKIIEFVFLPEAEAAEVLAGFAIWATQLTQAGIAVGNECN